MAFKRKQKELTLEETLELVKKERAPFWIGSPPLVAGVSFDGVASLHPLDAGLATHDTTLVFADPTKWSGEIALAYLFEWHRRFHAFGMRFILVLKVPAPAWIEPKTYERYIEVNRIKFPTVLDNDGGLQAGFGFRGEPLCVFLHEGKPVFSLDGVDKFPELEVRFQDTLRAGQPGLPLAPRFRYTGPKHADSRELNLRKNGGAVLGKREDAEILAKKNRQSWIDTLKDESVVLTGEWKEDGDSISTQDSKAELSIKITDPGLAVLARSVARGGEMSKCMVEIDGGPIVDTFAGRDLAFDERGHSFLEIRTLQLFRVFQDLPLKMREVTFRFPFAKQIPVAIFGFRMSR